MKRYAIYLCGGDMRPGPRETDCPDALHDFPLPSGYVDRSEEAMSRLSRGWNSKRCRRCGFYGWTPGRPRKGEQLVRVRPELVEGGPQVTPEEFVRRFPTIDDYMRHHQQAGHLCCMCPQQDPPLPCCNAGHDEADRLRVEFDRLISDSEAGSQ